MRWYDYEKMAGFTFPPAGEKVQFARLSYPWTDGEVIGMNSCGACVIEYDGGWIAIHYEDGIRPMDWDKLSKGSVSLSTQDILASTALNLCETLSNLIAELIDTGIVDQQTAQELLDNLYKDRSKE